FGDRGQGHGKERMQRETGILPQLRPVPLWRQSAAAIVALLRPNERSTVKKRIVSASLNALAGAILEPTPAGNGRLTEQS
ncbi:MAG: hypothetical protein ABIS68_00130, partial [Casimicrobiaceae bacterium]